MDNSKISFIKFQQSAIQPSTTDSTEQTKTNENTYEQETLFESPSVEVEKIVGEKIDGICEFFQAHPYLASIKTTEACNEEAGDLITRAVKVYMRTAHSEERVQRSYELRRLGLWEYYVQNNSSTTVNGRVYLEEGLYTDYPIQDIKMITEAIGESGDDTMTSMSTDETGGEPISRKPINDVTSCTVGEEGSEIKNITCAIPEEGGEIIDDGTISTCALGEEGSEMISMSTDETGGEPISRKPINDVTTHTVGEEGGEMISMSTDETGGEGISFYRDKTGAIKKLKVKSEQPTSDTNFVRDAQQKRLLENITKRIQELLEKMRSNNEEETSE